MEIYVGTPQKKAAEGTQSGGTRAETPLALVTDQGSASEGEDLRSEAAVSRHPEGEEWATAGPKKRKGKGKKPAAKGGTQPGHRAKALGEEQKAWTTCQKPKNEPRGMGLRNPSPPCSRPLAHSLDVFARHCGP